MAERNLGVRSFETRLAAMDRRLEEIREELSPEGETWLGRDEGDAVYAGLATEHAARSMHAGRAVVPDRAEQPIPAEQPVLAEQTVPAEHPAPAEHSVTAEPPEQLVQPVPPEYSRRAEQPGRAERPAVQEPTPQGSGVSHEPLRRLLVPSTDDPAAFAMLGGLCASLVESTRRLLDGYEAVLTQVSRPGAGERSAAPQPESKRRDPRPPGSGPAGSDKAEPGGLTMTAGPFASTESLREFERTLAGLPGVRDVALRGYEPANRAILEVQLEEQTS